MRKLLLSGLKLMPTQYLPPPTNGQSQWLSVQRMVWTDPISLLGFSGGLDGKETACNAGDTGSIPGSGRSPGGRQGKPLQYSHLENSMDREAWWATVHGVTTSWTRLPQIIHESIQNSGIWFCFIPLWSKVPLPSRSNAYMNICPLGRTSLVVQGLRIHLALYRVK